MNKNQKQSMSRKFVHIFCIIVCGIFIIFALQMPVLSQPVREWKFALMPNVQYAFPNGSKWLQDFKSRELKMKIVEVPDTLAGPTTAKPVDVWIALDGEYDTQIWEPLETSHTKVQIHFWPMTRSQTSNPTEIKYLVSDEAKIFYDRNDLLSRTCLTLFDALEATYEDATVNLVHRQDLNYPPFNEFRDGEKINTILLPLVNYYPNTALFRVIRYARRRSLDISSNEIRGKFCKELNKGQIEALDWPFSRISDRFFSGILPPDFLGLGQRQLWPIQTTAEIVLLICKKSERRLSNADKRLLISDLNTISQTLFSEADEEMNAETQKWQNRDNLTKATADSAWQITQKARWALTLCPDQQKNKNISEKLRRFVRDFSDTTQNILKYQERVRFRELDYLLDQKNFWAVNNLVSIYNFVGNYSGARVIAYTIIDTSINLTVNIPLDSKVPTINRKQQENENFANFLDNYAFALEKLEDVDPLLPPLLRREARNLRKKLKQNP